ncbi:MAG TPA: ABC transporter ATP-binding protein, partial [Candidatus Scybalomonas excrementigallinarum]|nr:ABC transporter ATP-binding protein [Candidatus Scybalomonas excrementigallinarum]
MNLLECKNLSKYYSGKCALDRIDLTIESGKIVGLLGPNGSGKSTLIKMISGLLKPSDGKLKVAGKDVGVETKKIVSYLPDHDYLNDWMKVEDIITMFEEFYDDFDRKRAVDMITKLNIDTKQQLKNLSKGTKEKVQLILVMSRHANLYLLDEPIGG